MSDAETETLISSERVFSGRVVTLDVDQIRLPDGSRAVREVVRHRGAVVLLPVLDDGRIVSVRQYRYPVAERLLELPAGTLERGENVRSCAARELAEETGWRAEALHELGRLFSTPGFTDEVFHVVLATGLMPTESGATPDPDERIDVVTLSVADALDRARTGELRDAKTLATLFLARLQGFI
jgi:ADP-ribose pyrophosphatase